MVRSAAHNRVIAISKGATLMIKLYIYLAIISLCLTGCSAEEIRRMNADSDAREQARNEDYSRGIRNTCSTYGFKEGTDAFANCIQREVANSNAAAYSEQQYWKSESCRLGNTWDCSNQQTQAPVPVQNQNTQACLYNQMGVSIGCYPNMQACILTANTFGGQCH